MNCRFVSPLAVPLHFLLDRTRGNLHFKNTSTASIKYRKRRNVGMASKPSGCITAKSAVQKSVFVFFLPPLLYSGETSRRFSRSSSAPETRLSFGLVSTLHEQSAPLTER